MKIFLILIIFICCFLIGINIKKYFKKRKMFYEDLYSFCENLINEISFNNQKLILIVKNNLNSFGEDFNKALILFERFLLNKISREYFEKSLNKTFHYLSNKEIDNFVKFLYSIGTQTKDEEMNKVKNYINYIKTPIDTENEKFKKYSNLYLKLFIALGLVFAIIFI